MEAPMTAEVALRAGEELTLEEVEQQLLEERRQQPEGTRPTTLNLICTTSNGDDARELAAALASIAPRHPGRFLLLLRNDSLAGEDDAGTWRVHIMRIRAPQAGRCTQLLQLEAGGRAWSAGSSAIAPLLLGELPVFLWWRGETPIDNRRFEDLASIADRVLFDSYELALDPKEFLRLAGLQTRLRRGCCVTDLVWARVTRWRQLLSQAWEAVEITRDCDVARLRFVACCSQPELNAASLLMAGWLSSRLRWKPAHAINRTTVEMHGPHNEAITLEFQPSAVGNSRALLHAIHVFSRDDRQLFSVSRKTDRVVIVLGEEAQGNEAVGDFQVVEPIEALREELDITGPDILFQQSLDGAVEILRTLGLPG
jgi:glucose-6-phosphate dehydrogenase assembly protein OpcA